MQLKEAKELLNKLSPLENKAKFKNGEVIHKFCLIPSKIIQDKDFQIDWNEFLKNKNVFQNNYSENIKYTIVAIHRSRYSTFLTSTNLEHFKELVNNN